MPKSTHENRNLPSARPSGSATEDLFLAAQFAIVFLTVQKRALDLDYRGYAVLANLEKAVERMKCESPNDRGQR